MKDVFLVDGACDGFDHEWLHHKECQEGCRGRAEPESSGGGRKERLTRRYAR